MTTTFYSTSTVNSFFAFEDFSQTFHRTPSSHSSLCSPPTPNTFQPEPELEFESGSQPDVDRACGSFGFMVEDVGLASCTEGLGFESSNMMISDDTCCDCCNFNRMISEDYYKNSSVNSDSINGQKREREKRISPSPEKKDFPPPLSSLSENGRRSFMLKPMRNDGRLQIVRVLINRPEILCASRQNGRLTLHLVGNFIDDESEPEPEYEYEEETGEEREDHEEEEVEEAEERQKGVEEKAVAMAAAEEEREWKIPAIRRCYQTGVLYAWSQQQHRCVTTI